ncbi:hypothetical protein BGX34_002844 [Mortierella sp. NVP85]|nr:hypothetical protein BGX34_002844 [Mortierella sp. NVP85]
MDETQLFRLTGTTVIEKIPYENIDGHNVIYWDDIEQVFPGVKHIKCKDVTVRLLRDSNQMRIEPRRIKYHPDVVLDVVLFTSGGNGLASYIPNRDAAGASTMEDIVDNLQFTSLSADTFNSGNRTCTSSKIAIHPSTSTLSDIKSEPRASLPFKRVEDAGLVQQLSIGSKAEQQVVPFLSLDVKVQDPGATNVSEPLIQVIKDSAVRLRELSVDVSEIKDTTAVILELVSMNNQLVFENKNHLTQITLLQQDLASKQDEMKELQLQALDRLAQLQNNVQALLTQTYELHEYPIPRLFIVLPDDKSSWNPWDFFSNKFRLYFLCECGEHTKATKGNIPHRIHLAKHEGYDIERPNEFFQQYGSYVLTILKMLKFGISVAGVAVPALSNLIPDSVDQAAESLKLLTKTIEPGMDQVISHIQKVSTEEGRVAIRSSEQMENNEALEGADLRQLETFLKNKDRDRVLGNLYRTVTIEGHVKWVCIDHYRENYHEKAAKAFRDALEALKGAFNENIGRVEVTLHSKVMAEQFYAALEKSKSVHELKVELDWELTRSDFKKLRDALAVTNVGILEIYLGQQDEPTRDRLNRSQRYDPLLDIMRHRSIQSFTVRGPCNFTKRSSLLSHNYDFSNLRHLDISLEQLRDDTPGVNYLIAKAPNLPSLTLGTDTGYTIYELIYENDYLVQAYNAIAEHQVCPIIFKEWDLRISPLPREPNRPIDAYQCKQHLFQDHWESASEVMLDGDTLESSALDALTKMTLGFQRLCLEQEGLLGKKFIENLSSIVSRSELSEIDLWMTEDKGRVRILESVQWKHLRELEIYLEPGTFETSVMRALVDGVTKMSEKIELEKFLFWTATFGLLTLPEGDILQSFVASTSIERIELGVIMTLEQIFSLLRSVDVSRLHHLEFWAGGFDSVEVDAILDGLQHATKLRELHLIQATLTEEQKNRMEAKGVSLSDEVSSESRSYDTGMDP